MDNTVRKPLGINYNDNPVTVGEKIRNKRLERQLRQKDIASLLEVSEDCITNWENNLAKPHVEHFPAITAFLGYNPFPIKLQTLGGRIKQYRFIHGLSNKKMGILLDVDASTIGSWEKGEHIPKAKTINRLKQLLFFENLALLG